MIKAVIVDVDGTLVDSNDLHEVQREEGLELHNVRVHILPRGARFSLSERKPLALEAAGQG